MLKYEKSFLEIDNDLKSWASTVKFNGNVLGETLVQSNGKIINNLMLRNLKASLRRNNTNISICLEIYWVKCWRQYYDSAGTMCGKHAILQESIKHPVAENWFHPLSCSYNDPDSEKDIVHVPLKKTIQFSVAVLDDGNKSTQLLRNVHEEKSLSKRPPQVNLSDFDDFLTCFVWLKYKGDVFLSSVKRF